MNALAFAPPRGAWSVEAHAHFPPALRKRCAKLLLLKPAHVPNVCWLRVLSYALDAREAEPLLASAAGKRRAALARRARRPVDSGATRP